LLPLLCVHKLNLAVHGVNHLARVLRWSPTDTDDALPGYKSCTHLVIEASTNRLQRCSPLVPRLDV